MPITYSHDHENEITVFAETNFRNARRRFGIKTDDRRRHMYVIGKTGMGKTTLLETLILSDIYAGHGCCYIDPHGDTAEKLLDFIPPHRINDVVYFNPADLEYPVGFNILETTSDDQKHLVRAGLMGVFKKIWPDVWSARMEYILQNCVSALLDYPGATLLGINRLLVDKEYRTRVVAKIRDPIVKTFWVAEFTSWSEKYATEAIAPVQNKVGQFLSSSVIRNIVAQVKSTIDVRRIMDDGKILIANLSKGRIGEDNMKLLGGMLITKLQLAAQERQNILMEDRRDFYLFVDEFQNFANESFASILSEARKYRLNLIVAHQYIEQLEEEVAAAIFGNVGTIIAMRVGGQDAEFMETEFAPTFTPEDLVNLTKYQMYLKLMVDGVATVPFSANSLPPIVNSTGTTEKVIAVSRERYAEPRAVIEEKVLKWAGMEAAAPAPTVVPPAAPVAEPATVAESPFATFTEESASEESVVEPEQPAAEEVGEFEAPALETAMEEATPSAVQYPAILTEDEREAEADTGEYLTIKPERLAAITAAQPAKKSKPQYPHTCTRCGKTWNLPLQLDPTRPMYCPECRPLILEERKQRTDVLKKMLKTPVPPEGVSAEPTAPELTEAAFSPADQQPFQANRPRVIKSERGADLPSGPESLFDEVARLKGGRVELHKKTLEKRAGPGLGNPPSEGGRKRKRKKRKRSGSFRDTGDSFSSPTDISLDVSPPVQHPKPSSAAEREAPRVIFKQNGSPHRPHPTSVAPGQRVRFDE